MRRKNMLRGAAGIALALMLAVGALVANPNAQSAQAVDYGVDLDHACVLGGYYGGAYLVTSNVHGWRCAPGSGSVNIQAYCSSAHPGSTAVYLSYSNPYSWRCRR